MREVQEVVAVCEVLSQIDVNQTPGELARLVQDVADRFARGIDDKSFLPTC